MGVVFEVVNPGWVNLFPVLYVLGPNLALLEPPKPLKEVGLSGIGIPGAMLLVTVNKSKLFEREDSWAAAERRFSVAKPVVGSTLLIFILPKRSGSGAPGAFAGLLCP